MTPPPEQTEPSGDREEPDGQQGQDEQDGPEDQHVVIVGADGQPVGAVPASALQQAIGEGQQQDQSSLSDLVEQPAKVMRIGSMVKQLLEEVKAAPLDEPSRQRLKEIHRSSVAELEKGLAPELVEELERLSLPFTDDSVPTEGELRIAQAQLVGWLEGLFHGIQTAIYAQQMAARAQLEDMRKALPGGVSTQQGQQVPQHGPAQGQREQSRDSSHGGGMYL